MAQIKLRGKSISTTGSLPAKGAPAPSFTLTRSDLTEVSLYDFKGKKVVLNIFPSIDTDPCATSVRRFNEEASKRDDTIVACVSADLPFAAGRFCGAEGLENVVTLSTFRDPNFGNDYGVRMVDGPLAGLMSRAVVVIDEDGAVVYTEQVPEITREPDYEAALKNL
jgi:thiol peroxidase